MYLNYRTFDTRLAIHRRDIEGARESASCDPCNEWLVVAAVATSAW